MVKGDMIAGTERVPWERFTIASGDADELFPVAVTTAAGRQLKIIPPPFDKDVACKIRLKK